MADLTCETLAEWRRDAEHAVTPELDYAYEDRILALLDALDAEKARAEFGHDENCEAEYEPGAHAWTPCGCWASRDEAKGLVARAEQAEAAARGLMESWRIENADRKWAEKRAADHEAYARQSVEAADEMARQCDEAEATLARVLADVEALAGYYDAVDMPSVMPESVTGRLHTLLAEHRDRS